jgi:hypothetical protein
VKKQAFAAAALLSTLLALALAGALFADLAAANPVFLPLKVDLTSPQNRTYTRTSVPVSFTYYATEAASYFCELDGQERVAFYPEFKGGAYRSTMSGLTDGAHNLTVTVVAGGPAIIHRGSSTAVFTVDAVPRISVLSPENGTYDKPDVPLDFVIKKPFSSVAYSLNGQANVTLSGNTTLTGLSAGVHNVTVYAWDEVGNMGASETVTFTVAEPFQTTLNAVAIVASAAVVSFGLIAYFLRRNKKGSEA